MLLSSRSMDWRDIENHMTQITHQQKFLSIFLLWTEYCRKLDQTNYRLTKSQKAGFEISNWMHLSVGQVDCKNHLSECTIHLSEIYKANATYVKIKNTQSSVGQVLQVFHLPDCHFYLSQTIGRVKFQTLKGWKKYLPICFGITLYFLCNKKTNTWFMILKVVNNCYSCILRGLSLWVSNIGFITVHGHNPSPWQYSILHCSLVKKDFQTWFLIGRWHSHQWIGSREQIRESLSCQWDKFQNRGLSIHAPAVKSCMHTILPRWLQQQLYDQWMAGCI